MSATLKFGGGEWGVKKGSTLAYNSENGNFKPLPFTFDRSTSATRVNKEGLIEVVSNNEPRIDFLNDSKGALLLEPERSNLILNSEKLSLSPFKNGTFTDDFAISPDGTQNASKFTAPSSDPYFYQSVSFVEASYTASIYVKGIGSSIGKQFRIVLGSVSSNPKLTIPSEWTRFEFTATMPSGSASAGLEIPDPAVVGDDVLVWGWQVEQGSYATSYIPTQGSIGTRVAESCSDAGNDQVINSTEGVLYAEISALANDGTNRYITVSDGTNTNRIILRFSTANRIRIDTVVGTNQFNAETNVNANQFYKAAFSYKQNEFKFYVNGVLIGSSTSGNVPSSNTYNVVAFSNPNGLDIFYGETKDLKIYNTALTDQELINLTTI